MLITLFTDASFIPKLSRATWAAWAKADGVTHRYSGIIRSSLSQSGDAELCAIANGIFVAIRRFVPPEGSKLIIQTDSLEAISAIEGKPHPRAYARMLVQSIISSLQHHSLIYEFRHVKGHKGTETRRNAINTWCDKECQRQMKILLYEIAPELPLRQPKAAK